MDREGPGTHARQHGTLGSATSSRRSRLLGLRALVHRLLLCFQQRSGDVPLGQRPA
jgi:hypothetical protein